MKRLNNEDFIKCYISNTPRPVLYFNKKSVYCTCYLHIDETTPAKEIHIKTAIQSMSYFIKQVSYLSENKGEKELASTVLNMLAKNKFELLEIIQKAEEIKTNEKEN